MLVHGLGGTGADVWKHQIADLAESFRVVTYDLRGSGRSEVSPGPYSIGLLCDDLRALVDALALGRVALVAHSMGGSIALMYAARYSGDVTALVGIGAPAEFPDQARTGLEGRAQTVEADGMDAVAETVATNGVSPTFREGQPEEFRKLVAMLARERSRGLRGPVPGARRPRHRRSARERRGARAAHLGRPRRRLRRPRSPRRTRGASPAPASRSSRTAATS